MQLGMASLQAFDGRLADTAALMAESGALADSMKSGAHQMETTRAHPSLSYYIFFVTCILI